MAGKRNGKHQETTLTVPLFTPIALCDRPRGKLTVAIDLDHTTVAYGSAVESAAERLGIEYTPDSGYLTYEMFPVPFRSFENWHEAHIEAMTRGEMELLDPTFSDSARRIRKAGHKLLVLTSREDEFYDQTAAMLSSHEVEYDELILTNDKTGHGADVLYDDKSSHLEQARDAGIIAIRKPWPYNQEVTGVYDATTTSEVADWLGA